MSHRQVRGLIWARRAERPTGLPHGRARGAKAAGLRYEAGLARALPDALHGQWFQFQDERGLGWCQPDLLFEESGLILEAKYTWVPEGHSQLESLYLPVVGRALQRRVFGLVVCRALPGKLPPGVTLVHSLAEGRSVASRGLRAVWHCLGDGAFAPRPRARAARPSQASSLAAEALGL